MTDVSSATVIDPPNWDFSLEAMTKMVAEMKEAKERFEKEQNELLARVQPCPKCGMRPYYQGWSKLVVCKTYLTALEKLMVDPSEVKPSLLSNIPIYVQPCDLAAHLAAEYHKKINEGEAMKEMPLSWPAKSIS